MIIKQIMANKHKGLWFIGTLLMANLIINSFILGKMNLPSSSVDTAPQVASTNDSPAATLNNRNDSPTVALVNGLNISKIELLPYLNQKATQKQLAEWRTLSSVPTPILEQAIKNAALDKLLIQVAEEKKIPQIPKVQATIKLKTQQLVKKALLNSIIPNLVNETDIKNQYNSLAASLVGKIEYRARHILLKNKKEAHTIIKALKKKKKSFSELAKEFSLDEPSNINGGDLGYKLPGQLSAKFGAKFEKAINKLKIDQTSKPFKTELGWHIAVVNDRREVKPMSYNQAVPKIRWKLERQAAQQYLDDLLASAKIEILITPTKTKAAPTSTQ